jgi:hypothetical protein
MYFYCQLCFECSDYVFSAKLPYASPPQKSMIWNQPTDLIQLSENNKSSTLSGVGLCKVRLELLDNKINTQFNTLTT